MQKISTTILQVVVAMIGTQAIIAFGQVSPSEGFKLNDISHRGTPQQRVMSRDRMLDRTYPSGIKLELYRERKEFTPVNDDDRFGTQYAEELYLTIRKSDGTSVMHMVEQTGQLANPSYPKPIAMALSEDAKTFVLLYEQWDCVWPLVQKYDEARRQFNAVSNPLVNVQTGTGSLTWWREQKFDITSVSSGEAVVVMTPPLHNSRNAVFEEHYRINFESKDGLQITKEADRPEKGKHIDNNE